MIETQAREAKLNFFFLFTTEDRVTGSEAGYSVVCRPAPHTVRPADVLALAGNPLRL